MKHAKSARSNERALFLTEYSHRKIRRITTTVHIGSDPVAMVYGSKEMERLSENTLTKCFPAVMIFLLTD